MSWDQYEGTLEECVAIIATEDAHAGFPSRGVSLGAGPRKPIQATWDGTGKTPAGWTRTFAVPEAPPAESPARKEWPRVGSSGCAQSQR